MITSEEILKQQSNFNYDEYIHIDVFKESMKVYAEQAVDEYDRLLDVNEVGWKTKRKEIKEKIKKEL